MRSRRLLQLPAVMHTTSDTASVGNFLVFVSLSGVHPSWVRGMGCIGVMTEVLVRRAC